METKRIKQTTQNTILKDRVKLEDIEQEEIIKAFHKGSSNIENTKTAKFRIQSF